MSMVQPYRENITFTRTSYVVSNKIVLGDGGHHGTSYVTPASACSIFSRAVVNSWAI